MFVAGDNGIFQGIAVTAEYFLQLAPCLDSLGIGEHCIHNDTPLLPGSLSKVLSAGIRFGHWVIT